MAIYQPRRGWRRSQSWDFPDGSAIRNPSASAGDTASIPDPRRSHMQRSSWAPASQTLSLCSRVTEPQLLKSAYPRACAQHQEKLPQWEACTLQLESRPHLPQLEKIPSSDKDSAQPKINIFKNHTDHFMLRLIKKKFWIYNIHLHNELSIFPKALLRIFFILLDDVGAKSAFWHWINIIFLCFS